VFFAVVFAEAVLGLFFDPGGRPRLFGAVVTGDWATAGLALFFEPFGRPLRFGAAEVSTTAPFNGAVAAFSLVGVDCPSSLTGPFNAAEE